MNTRIYLMIFLVVLSCSLSCTNAEFRIVHGVGIRMQDSPHSVSIFICGSYRCGGSLVKLNAVVTVANCVYFSRLNPGLVDVVAGMVDIRLFGKKVGQKQKAFHIFVHPYFTFESRYADISVVKFDDYFKKTETVNPVPLCRPEVKLGTVRVSGWGAVTLNEGARPSDVLLTTTVTIIQEDECQNYINTLPEPKLEENTIICGKGRGSYMAVGDHGAGATVDGELCAVVQSGCSGPNMPNLFTNITHSTVLDFLNAYID